MPHSNAHSRESIEWVFLQAISSEVVCPVYSSQGSFSNGAPPLEDWSQLAEPTRHQRLYFGVIPRRRFQTSSQRAVTASSSGPPSHAFKFSSSCSGQEAPRMTESTWGRLRSEERRVGKECRSR